MNTVLRGLIWIFALVYIDNIVVYAQSYAELHDRLAVVFQRLQSANLKLKPSKVWLFQREIKFLGHCVSGRGIAVDESKMSDILQWSVARNVHEIHQFLGLCGYYRRYVQDYTKHAAPLHELTKSDVTYEWTMQRQAAIDFLKQALMSAPY